MNHHVCTALMCTNIISCFFVLFPVDFDLNDVESQVKNMEAEMNSLEYRYSIKISSSKSNSKMDGIESEKLNISDNELYHLSTDGQMTELSLLKNLVLEIGI